MEIEELNSLIRAQCRNNDYLNSKVSPQDIEFGFFKTKVSSLSSDGGGRLFLVSGRVRHVQLKAENV
jgi:hypothetical protein